MRLGFMQPYFLPYVGYFALIRASDVWVVFDDAQFIRHGWVDRNRILHPQEGWQYIKVPLARHPREAEIRAVTAAPDSGWRERVIRQLGHYRKAAPYYEAVIEFLREAFAGAPEALDRLDAHLLERVCARLGVPFAPVFHSELEYDRSAVAGPGDWARVVARHLGASEYVNPPGGRDLFDREAFARDGVRLRILEVEERPYPQCRERFESFLSIVDVMMFNSVERIHELMEATIE